MTWPVIHTYFRIKEVRKAKFKGPFAYITWAPRQYKGRWNEINYLIIN